MFRVFYHPSHGGGFYFVVTPDDSEPSALCDFCGSFDSEEAADAYVEERS